eukprot:6177308-Pleurochrysis_carterae.AAC.1
MSALDHSRAENFLAARGCRSISYKLVKYCKEFPHTCFSTLSALLLTYSTMPATRLCFDDAGNLDEIVTSLHDGPIVDGWSAYPFVRQNSGDVTLRSFHQTLACHACLPFLPCVGLYGLMYYSFSTSNLHVCTLTECPLETEPLMTR